MINDRNNDDLRKMAVVLESALKELSSIDPSMSRLKIALSDLENTFKKLRHTIPPSYISLYYQQYALAIHNLKNRICFLEQRPPTPVIAPDFETIISSLPTVPDGITNCWYRRIGTGENNSSPEKKGDAQRDGVNRHNRNEHPGDEALAISVRLLSEKEAYSFLESYLWRSFGKKISDDDLADLAHIIFSNQSNDGSSIASSESFGSLKALFFEISIENISDKPVVIDLDDERKGIFLYTWDNLRFRRRPSNSRITDLLKKHSALSKKNAGIDYEERKGKRGSKAEKAESPKDKEHDFSNPFDLSAFTLEPYSYIQRYALFTEDWNGRFIKASQIANLYYGDWRLIPAQPLPQGYRDSSQKEGKVEEFPTRTIMLITSRKIPEGKWLNPHTGKIDYGVTYPPGIEFTGEREEIQLEREEENKIKKAGRNGQIDNEDRENRHKEKGKESKPNISSNRVFFLTEDRVYIPFSKGYAFTTALSTETGSAAFFKAGEIEGRGASPAFNIIDCHDVREKLTARGMFSDPPVLLWQHYRGEDYNNIRGCGQFAVLQSRYAPHSIVDDRGNLICVHFRQFYEKLIYPFRTAPKSSSKNDEVEKREERDQGNNEEEQERCTERVRDEDRILLASRDGQYFYTYDGSYLISRKMNGLISFRTEIGQGLQSLDVHPLTGIVLGVENTTSLGNSLIMLDYHGFLRRRLVNTPLIHGLCVSPDGKYIFATDKNWKMALLDPTLNTVVEKNLPPYSCGSFFGAEFSHDSSSLLAAVGGICLYSVPSLELLWRRKAPGEITGIAWLADGKRFAITTRNGHLVIYSSSGNVLGKWVLEGNGIEGLASFKGTRNIIAVTTQDGYYYGLEVPTQSL